MHAPRTAIADARNGPALPDRVTTVRVGPILKRSNWIANTELPSVSPPTFRSGRDHNHRDRAKDLSQTPRLQKFKNPSNRE